MGLAAKMPAAWHIWGTLAVFVGLTALLVAGAGLWLRSFPRGPFELVMHRAHARLVARTRTRARDREPAAP